MKILYEQPLSGDSSRKVFIDDELFTYLRYAVDDTVLADGVFADTLHPYVNLAKLFTGVLNEEVHFHSTLDLHIEIKIL